MTNKRTLQIFSVCITVLSLTLIFFLLTQTTMFCDDYRYATFFKDGFGQFIENTKEHYLITNGRALIHVIIPIVLLFKSKLYMFLFPLIIFVLFYLGTKNQMGIKEKNYPVLSYTLALSFLLFLGMNLGYFRSTVFWISGSFNYIFPLLLLFLALLLQKRSLDRNKFSPLALISCFIAGATTEQVGTMLIAGLFILGLIYFAKRKCGFIQCFLPVLLGIAGLLTVVLAPGTSSRITNETDGGILSLLDKEIFADRYINVVQYFCGTSGYPLLIILFSISTWMYRLVDKNKSSLLYTGIPISIALISLHILELYTIFSIVFIAYALFCVVIFSLNEQTEVTATIILMAIASQGIIMATIIFSYRVAVPGLLMLIIATSYLFANAFSNLKPRYGIILLIIMLCTSLYTFVPIVLGSASTHKVISANLDNLERAKETGKANITVDFTDEYGYALIAGDEYFHYDFRKAYDVDDSIEIYFQSDKLPKVYVNNKLSTSPTWFFNNVTYFPIISILSSYNIESVWHDEGYLSFEYNGNTITFKDNKAIITDKNNAVISEEEALIYNEFVLATYYVDADALKEIFGLQWQYSKSDKSYYISTIPEEKVIE